MTTSIRALFIGAAALASVAAIAPAAWAGCGKELTKQPASWQVTPDNQANPLLTRVSLGDAPIVGLWSVQFFAGGSLIDFGYQVWHGDGTEFMNSGGHTPASQNYCLGVWAQTGSYSYKLNHFALAYDPTGKLAAKINIKENVNLDVHADYFSGTFTIDASNPTTGAPLQHIAGRVTGNRIKVN